MAPTEYRVVMSKDGHRVDEDFTVDVLPEERIIDFGDVDALLREIELNQRREDIHGDVLYQLMEKIPPGTMLGIGRSPNGNVKEHMTKLGWTNIASTIGAPEADVGRNGFCVRVRAEELAEVFTPGRRVNLVVAENVFTNDGVAANVSTSALRAHILDQIRAILVPGGFFYTGNTANAFSEREFETAGFNVIRTGPDVDGDAFFAQRVKKTDPGSDYAMSWRDPESYDDDYDNF